MRIIITEDQFNRNISFIRRLSIADDIISKLNPKNICKICRKNKKDALYFADDVIVNIVWEINRTLGVESYHNKDLYKFFEDIGYYDKLKEFFYKSFELCE
jgi:hypothetical protein